MMRKEILFAFFVMKFVFLGFTLPILAEEDKIFDIVSEMKLFKDDMVESNEHYVAVVTIYDMLRLQNCKPLLLYQSG